jgi:hypothetical protein
MTRKTRTLTMGPREVGGCDQCLLEADVKVQVSTPNGRSYRTAGLLCRKHNTTENVNWIFRLATEYLGDES